MTEFVLHPDALNDLQEIWEYIAADSLDAADRVREEIYDTIKSLILSHTSGIAAQTSQPVPCAFKLSATM